MRRLRLRWRGICVTVPDPVFTGVKYHILLSRCLDVPEGVPKFNVRMQNDIVSTPLYRSVKAHLVGKAGVPNTFYHMSCGMVILAQSLTQVGDEEWEIVFLVPDKEGETARHGIADGAHTYDIILTSKSELLEYNARAAETGGEPLNQWISVQIFAGLDPALAPLVAKGRSATKGVAREAHIHFDGHTKWMKGALADEPYVNDIKWTQGDRGCEEVANLIRPLICLDVVTYPPSPPVEGMRHPFQASGKKDWALAEYQKVMETAEPWFPFFEDVLPEIVELCDLIRFGSYDLFKRAGKRLTKNRRKLFHKLKPGGYRSSFSGESSQYKLQDGIYYPMLAAFRCMLELKKRQVQWRGGFAAVRQLLDRAGVLLLERFVELLKDDDASRLGKRSSTWRTMYELLYLQREMLGS